VADKDRGKKPTGSAGKLAQPSKPAINYNDEHPKFCLRYLTAGYDVHSLDPAAQGAFARCLQKLAGSRWKDLITAPKHGQGTEHIPRSQIRATVPNRFQDNERFMVFRYSGTLPMAGVRVDDVFHILWIERCYGELYDHGS
jgi:hypothetical protein